MRVCTVALLPTHLIEFIQIAVSKVWWMSWNAHVLVLFFMFAALCFNISVTAFIKARARHLGTDSVT